MRIAVCEDDLYFLNYASKIIKRCFSSYPEECYIDSFSNSTTLLKILSSRQYYNVIFLDIDMPETDGITIGKFLRKAEADTFIIYLSNREELVFDTFRTRPFSFIPKTQFKERIRPTIESVYRAYKEKQTNIFLTIGGIRYQWDIQKLVYIECSNKTLHLHFTDCQLDVVYQIGLLEQELAEYGFIRIHKGYLVNYRFIFCIEKDFVRLDTQEQLPLSKHRAADVKKAFIQFTV